MAIKKYHITVDECGTTRWYKDAEHSIRHGENGPAVECADGTRRWYQEGVLHRTDGPAIERNDGSMEWYINDEELTETEFLAATQPAVEMTVADVEKLLGKRVKIIK